MRKSTKTLSALIIAAAALFPTAIAGPANAATTQTATTDYCRINSLILAPPVVDPVFPTFECSDLVGSETIASIRLIQPGRLVTRDGVSSGVAEARVDFQNGQPSQFGSALITIVPNTEDTAAYGNYTLVVVVKEDGGATTILTGGLNSLLVVGNIVQTYGPAFSVMTANRAS